MRKIKALAGIGALMLGLWSAQPAWAQSEELSASGVITAAEIVGAMREIGRLLRPANDNSAGDNNLYFGFAQSATGYDVPGGMGVCFQSTKYPSLSVCLQQLSGLSLNDCDLRSVVSSAAIQNTPVVKMQTVNPISGNPFPTVYGALGGTCYQPDMQAGGYFAGWLGGDPFQGGVPFLKLGDHLPNYVCAWLMNISGSPSSCGPYRH